MKRRKAVLASGIHRERFKIGELRETLLGEICPHARERFPYYFRLPVGSMRTVKDFRVSALDLLKWRRYVRHRCIRDLKFRAAVWEACRRDFLFFCVTFLWIFEPRPNPRRVPFFPYPDQVSIASWILEIYGVRDGAINKTRGIGMSWLVIAFIFWMWMFERDTKIAVLTEDEKKLDTADSNSTLGKLQYLYDHLPTWAKFGKSGKPLLLRTKEDHFFLNTENDALVQGYVSTGTKLRQLRFTWLFADEFAFYPKHSQEEWMTASGGTVNARLFVSTWNSFDDMFHQIVHEQDTSMLKISAFWWNNIERWQGAYKMDAGLPVFVDKGYAHPPDYAFGEPGLLDDGQLRSPWVDGELLLPGADRLKTLRDLYGMTVAERTNSFFPGEIRIAVRETLRTPDREGILHLSNGRITIQPTKKSDLRLWSGVPDRYRGPYTCFCDLAQGVGQAYHVASFFDASGQQVCEYGINTIDLVTFGANVCALARWLGGPDGDAACLIDAEANGPYIKPFIGECLRQNYGNLWTSMIQDRKARRKKIQMGEIGNYYGTRNSDRGRANLLEMARAIMSMECVIRSERVADEIKHCGKDEDDGGPKFAKASASRGHGDFVQAAAGAWWRLRSTVDLEARNDETTESSVEYVEPWKPQSRWSSQYESTL